MSDRTRSFGWLGALVRGVIVVVLGAVLLAIGPNLLLTKLTSIDRSTRVALATTWFGLWFVVLSVVLRRLQQRHVL